MNLFFDAVNGVKNQNSNYQGSGSGKEDKMRNQLFQCTYNDEYFLNKAV